MHASLRESLMKQVNIPENQYLGDFSQKDTLTQIDPENPGQFLSLSIGENQSSLFMNAIKRKLDGVANKGLTKEEVEMKEHLITMVDFISGLRVVDARVLLKIYDLYKFKPF